MIRPIYPLRHSHFPTSILSQRILREQRALQSETDDDETLEYILVLFMYFGLSATKGAAPGRSQGQANQSGWNMGLGMAIQARSIRVIHPRLTGLKSRAHTI